MQDKQKDDSGYGVGAFIGAAGVIIALLVASIRCSYVLIGMLGDHVTPPATLGAADLGVIEQRLGVIEEAQKSELRALNLLLSAQIKAGRLKVVRKGEEVEKQKED